MTSGIRWMMIWGIALAAWVAARAESASASASISAGDVGDPDVGVVLRRMSERAQAVAGATNEAYGYSLVSYHETLDASGGVKNSKEKAYEVTLRRGMTHNRLLAINGRPLNAAESQVQSEKENRWRETYAGGRGGSRMERMDQLVNEALFSRFEFALAGREPMRGHPCWILEFKPRASDLPEERLIDRVINRLHGRIWVSIADSEIVRADVETAGTLKLWGGLLGSLETFRLHLDRDRSDPGIWYNRHTEVTVRARRLFTPIHVRLREIADGLRRLGPADAEGGSEGNLKVRE
ncbi:MAG: hypothetical protein AB7O66_12605 [Limisphaerales bacterium]